MQLFKSVALLSLVVCITSVCFSEKGRIREETAAKVGELLGAQILVRGAVTSFDEKVDEAGGLGISLPGGLGLGARVTRAYVGIDLRMYDTSTGEVLAATNIEKKPYKIGLALAGLSLTKGVALGGIYQSKTPLGQAIRECIKEAVEFICSKVEAVPWQARVVTVKEDKIYLNVGVKENITKDTVLDVYKIGEALIDPETGLSLGSEEKKIGSVRIIDVKEKFSIAEILTGDLKNISRGDICKMPETKELRKITPKKRIAVAGFETRVPSAEWHIGHALSDILTTELVKTKKFIVVERQDLESILKEQNLGQLERPIEVEKKVIQEPVQAPLVFPQITVVPPCVIPDIPNTIPETLPEDGEVVDTKPEFSWPKVKGAACYKLTVAGEEDKVIWSITLPNNVTSVVYGKLPEGATGVELTKPLKSKTRYVWTLAAIDEKGKVLAIGGGKFRTK